MAQTQLQIEAEAVSIRSSRIKSLAYLVWAIIGICIIAVAVGYVLGKVAAALAIIALSAFIVFILRVPVAWLEKRGVPRLLGSLIAYLGGLLIITLVLLIFIPLIWEQALGLLRMIPGYINEATENFNALYDKYSYLLENSNISQIVGSAASSVSSWATSMLSSSAQGMITLGAGVLTTVIVLMVSLIAGFWILMDLPKIGRELCTVIGPTHEESALFITTTLSKTFGGYLRGMTICAICTGTIAGAIYFAIGLPYPAVLGLLTGLLNFVPYVGPWASGATAALLGLFVSPLTALLAIIGTIVAQQAVDMLIYPRVMSTMVKLHPAIVLIGVFAGGALGGIIGLIAAVPLLASLKLIFVHYFEKKTGRKLENEDGAFFRGSSDGVTVSKQAKADKNTTDDKTDSKKAADNNSVLSQTMGNEPVDRQDVSDNSAAQESSSDTQDKNCATQHCDMQHYDMQHGKDDSVYVNQPPKEKNVRPK